MERVILIKYGELTTKKGNRNFFVSTLYQTLKRKLSNFEVSIDRDLSRMIITFEEKDIEAILKKINTIFGIHAYYVAYKVSSDINIIKEKILESLHDVSFKTFKVETTRSDKSFPYDSMEISRILGGVILKNKQDIKVDVHHPDVIFHVEVRRDGTFLYTKVYYGLGGYPVGTQNKGMLMLSGGIDSPVAGYLALKRGIKLDCVYFEALPHTSLEARNKVIDLCKKLSIYTNKIHLHIVPFTKIQEEIYKTCEPNYVITIMRRMMYRIMVLLAKKHKGYVIINGESVGQVASQTLTSMRVINEVTSMPVLRPVACLDKLEIIDIAKKIDTYDISILPFEDCCTVFVPKHPIINPILEDAITFENRFDYETLIHDTLKEVFTMVICEDMKDEFSDLL